MGVPKLLPLQEKLEKNLFFMKVRSSPVCFCSILSSGFINSILLFIGHFCKALPIAVKKMKEGEKAMLTVQPDCKLYFVWWFISVRSVAWNIFSIWTTF